ncbi:MAG TPA: WbqC family protein [Chitinophagales bacterium]|nr:WbqC family protein [Chitinophagales bacterium]
MQPILIESQYAGNCSYWNLLLKSKEIYIDTHEHYVRRSYRNRTHILGANGLLRLSIPLESGKSQHAAMKDVRISYNERWQELHWHSMVSAYSRSPYFDYYEDYLKKFYKQKFELLIDFNFQLMQTIASILKVDLSVKFTEKYFSKDEFFGTDYRSFILPNKKSEINFSSYPQVFSDRFPFEADLSILDVLFNKGTTSVEYLSKLSI